MAYALYGLFDVSPGANYGERHAGAKTRLLAAIAQRQDIKKSKELEAKKAEKPEQRGTIHFATLRLIKKFLCEREAESGWELIDEFEPDPTVPTPIFPGGTFMATYPDHPTTQIYLTLPSTKADNRADFMIIAPNATFYPGKHCGHIIFASDYPFNPPSIY